MEEDSICTVENFTSPLGGIDNKDENEIFPSTGIIDCVLLDTSGTHDRYEDPKSKVAFTSNSSVFYPKPQPPHLGSSLNHLN